VDGRTWTLVLNTLLLSGATCAISVPLGTALAWLLVRTDLPGRRIGLILLGVLLFVPLYLQSAAWQAGFGLQGWHTLIYQAPVWLEGWTGAIWVHTVASVPWVVLIVGGGLWLVRPELEEQALLDGSPGQVLLSVTLCSALPAVAMATLWVAIVTAGEITVTDLFVVRTYAEEVYTRFAVGQQPGEASLGALPGVITTVFLVAAGLLLAARLAPGERPVSLRPRWVFGLGCWRVPAALLVGAMFLLLIAVPLGNLFYKAGVLVMQTDTGRVRTWSAWKCLAIIASSPWLYRREFGYSLGIGILAATGAVAAAIFLAWPARSGGLRALPALLITGLCLAVPGPVVGLAIIWLLNRPGCGVLVWLYDRSILGPWIALLVAALPLTTLIMWHALRTVPAQMLESAATEGAGPLVRLVRIALPCRWPALGLSWLVALALALADLDASILAVPPGVTTLSIRIFGLLHYGVEDQVAGICLALVGLFTLVALAVGHLAKRWREG